MNIKKYLIVIVVVLTICNLVAAPFTINGRHIVYNQTDSMYMCVLPDSLFYGKDYSAIIHPDTLFEEKIDSITADTTLYEYLVNVCDTTLLQDTVVNCDSVVLTDTTIVVDSIIYRVDTAWVCDTVLMQDTVVNCDSIVRADSLFVVDTIVRMDTAWVCDTIFAQDTMEIVCDSVIRMDSVFVVDTIIQLDTAWLCDTVLMQDTLVHCDSILRMDSTILFDTIVHIDSAWVCDTLVMRDTLITCDSISRTDTIIMLDTIYRMDTIVWQSMQLDDDSVALVGDSIVFKNIVQNKRYRLEARLSNDSLIGYDVVFSNLPIVVLNGEFGYDYAPGEVSIYFADSIVCMENMAAKIKWRGGSTNSATKHKRNYTIKFLNEKQKKQKRQFFGLRNHNQWILNAGQIDLGRCRNHIGHELWNDIARKPYYIDKEPEALTNVRGKFVEVLLNQEYRGLYSMSENIDQEQTRVKEYDEDNGIIHGQLWKADSWDGTGMYDLMTYDNEKETYRGFETKYPDFEDVNPTDYSVLYNAIKFALRSNDTRFFQDLDTYFDIPILIDYYIFMNVLVALDNNGKNMFWVCYDKEESPKLTIAVWDLDCTVGQNFNDKDPHPASFGPEVDMQSMKVIKVIDRIRQHPAYADSIYNRYWELRETHLHTDSLIARYENYFKLFQRGGAASREEQRWSGDTDIAGLTLDFEQELAFIKDWIEKRISFLDNGEFYRADVTTGISTSENNSGNTTYYNLLGLPVENPTSGVYIKGGKKILIP